MSRIDDRTGAEPSDGPSTVAEGAAAGGGAPGPVTAGVPLTEILPRTLVGSPAVVMLDPSPSVVAEKFRRLKTKIVNEYKNSAQVIVITSAAPREGKSLVALNLALAFAADPGETLLVDADLRRPSVQQHLSPAPALGLSDVLRGATTVDHALLRLKNSPLRVLPGGNAVSDSVELLASNACRDLIAASRSRYQRIIVDTPPVVPFTDADTVGAYSDGVILVVRAGATPRTAFTQAISLITSARILGTVLNDVTFSMADYGHYHDYYHSYYHKESKP